MLQKDHEKQLEDLQQAGHQTLTVVVNEYKALLSTTIAQQQETLETRFVERLKEEAEKFQQVLRQQVIILILAILIELPVFEHSCAMMMRR